MKKVSVYGTLYFYILIYLYNYFIMHDIKYFFLNKINQTIQGEGQKKISGDKLSKALSKSPCYIVDPPCAGEGWFGSSLGNYFFFSLLREKKHITPFFFFLRIVFLGVIVRLLCKRINGHSLQKKIINNTRTLITMANGSFASCQGGPAESTSNFSKNYLN
jgi:hypothetical protein